MRGRSGCSLNRDAIWGPTLSLTVQGHEKEDWRRSGVTDGGSGGERDRIQTKLQKISETADKVEKPKTVCYIQ